MAAWEHNPSKEACKVDNLPYKDAGQLDSRGKVLSGIKWLAFKNRSTITRIVVKLSEGGMSMIKSIEMFLHGRSGTGNDIRRSTGVNCAPEINQGLKRSITLNDLEYKWSQERLQSPQNTAVCLFLIFLIIYCVTICGNLLIITLVYHSKNLHTPMYFFLSQLSVLDILLATTIIPNMLHSLLVRTLIMPFSHCLIQFYFFGASEISECLLLTVMSYDRYLAICRPLHYVLAMSHRLCWIMVITSWTLPIFVVLIDTITISKLEFSGPDIIDHFFCDFYPILEMSSTDTTIFQLAVTFLSIIFAVMPFSVIIVSYVYIIITIFKMSSISGRQKAFSTCSSHMTVVSIYYCALISIYSVPNRENFHSITKFLSLLYTVVTPLMNPIIYSLRNEEIKHALRTFMSNLIEGCS
ncbi:olfactory receptor 10A7-like [Gastrophryne carolinensis]